MIAPVVGKWYHYDRPIHYKRRVTILNKISNKKLTKNDHDLLQLIDLKLVLKNKPVELDIDRLLREYALYTLNSCILYYFLQY